MHFLMIEKIIGSDSKVDIVWNEYNAPTVTFRKVPLGTSVLDTTLTTTLCDEISLGAVRVGFKMWSFCGHVIIRSANDHFNVTFSGFMMFDTPQVVVSRVMRTGGEEFFKHRGYVLRTYCESSRSGNKWVKTEVSEHPVGRERNEGILYRAQKVGTGDTLRGAFRNAFFAPVKEVTPPQPLCVS
jgi:hypothetical protein